MLTYIFNDDDDDDSITETTAGKVVFLLLLLLLIPHRQTIEILMDANPTMPELIVYNFSTSISMVAPWDISWDFRRCNEIQREEGGSEGRDNINPINCEF